MSISLEVGQQLRVTIESVAFGGEGIARINGIVCFVSGGVLPQEEVLIKIAKQQGKKRAFLRAELIEVLDPSPARVEPPCPYFTDCGGCLYQHIDYQEQLVIKRHQVKEALQRIAGLAEPLVHPTVASPHPLHYRNRIRVHAQEGALGFFSKPNSHKNKAHGARVIIPIEYCLIASSRVNQQFAKLQKSHLCDGAYLVGEQSRYGGFRQVNDAVAELLGAFVQKKVNHFSQETGSGLANLEEQGGSKASGDIPKKEGILIDAYCGNGFFAHLLRDQFERVIGIERASASLRRARETAAEHQEFLEGSVEEVLPVLLSQFSEEELQQTTLLLDPPAEGIGKEIITTLLGVAIARIIVISCDPTTLARDIKRLGAEYSFQETTPFDMFAQTAEIETFSLLLHRTVSDHGSSIS